MTMTIEQIEAEVLKLPEEAQAELLERLMHSLTDAVGIDQEAAEAWASEAVHRDDEMESGTVIGIPAQQVFDSLKRKGK